MSKVFCVKCSNFVPILPMLTGKERCKIGGIKRKSYKEEYWEYSEIPCLKNKKNDCKDFTPCSVENV